MAKTDSGEKAAIHNTAKPNTKARTAAVLAVGMIVVVAVFALNASGLAKMAVEKIASQALGVKVSLASLDISLQDRQVDAGGITVANPQGFKSANAVQIGDVHIAADEISETRLVFNQIRVSGTVVNLEVSENKTNLIELHKNLNARAGNKAAGDGAEPLKVIIRELVIEGATLNPAVTLAGAPMQPVIMPDIRMSGIGEQEGGVLPGQVMTMVTDRVVVMAMRTAVQNRYLQGMDQESLEQIQKALGLPSGIMDQVRDFGDKVRGFFKD